MTIWLLLGVPLYKFIVFCPKKADKDEFYDIEITRLNHEAMRLKERIQKHDKKKSYMYVHVLNCSMCGWQ